MGIRAFLDEWVLFFLAPVILFIFLIVIFSMTGDWVFSPSIDFFKILIQLATSLIVFGGTLTIFTVSQIETLISELRAEIIKKDKEIALGPKLVPQVADDSRLRYDPRQIMRDQYDESIGRWASRVRQVVKFLMGAILAFIFSISISLGYIAIDPSTISKGNGANWGLGSLFFIGIGIEILLIIVKLIEPLKIRK